MTAAAVLFPLGVRLSTWVVLAVFVAVAVRRDEWPPVLAAAAWLTGWEATFQVASFASGNLPVGPVGPTFLVVVGAVTVPIVTRAGVHPDLRLLGVAFLVFAVWVATGFHVNGHSMVGFDPAAEALNEAAKTLWAVAYLVPFWRRHVSSVGSVVVSESRPDVEAAAGAGHLDRHLG